MGLRWEEEEEELVMTSRAGGGIRHRKGSTGTESHRTQRGSTESWQGSRVWVRRREEGEWMGEGGKRTGGEEKEILSVVNQFYCCT